MELNFKHDIRIDPDALDVEFLRQANLYMRYAEESARANDRLKRAEERLKVVRSELVLEASEKGEAVLGKGVKATAQTIEAYFRTHPDHQQAKEDYHSAAYDAEMLQNALYALQQKKTALENLAKLYSSSYFAGPTTPRNLGDEFFKLVESRESQNDDATRAAIKTSLNDGKSRRTRNR